MPKVSVIVPVFQAEKYIDQCLGSLANQTLAEIEIICVDDCGADGTMEIAERYAEKDARFRILRHDKNSGQGRARNTGLKNALSEFIVFIDNDDWVELDCIERLHRRMVEGDAGCVLAKQMRYDAASGRTKPVDLPGIAGCFDIPSMEGMFSTCTACAKIFRRDDLLKSAILFPEDLRHEDMEFFFDFHALYPRMVVLDYYGYYYRRHADSTTGGFAGGKSRPDHVAEMMRRSHVFLERHNCLEENKKFLLDFYIANMDAFLCSRIYKREAIEAFRSSLLSLGYPGQFAECRRDDLDMIMTCKNDPSLYKWYKPLKLLNSLNPFPRPRKKMAAWLRINCRARGK